MERRLSATNMNIWIVSKYAGLPKYGFGARLYYLAREFVRAGHGVVLLTSDANHLATFPETSSTYNDERVEGVAVRWLRTRKYRRTASLSRVLSWIDFEWKLFRMSRAGLPPPDVVIVSSLSLLSVGYGYFLKRRYAARLVFEVRDIWPLTMVAEGGFHRWHPLVLALGLIERFGYRCADLVVGTMPRLDLHVRDVLGRDRPFHCAPFGYAPEWITQQETVPDGFVHRHVPDGRIIFAYAGSFGTTNALGPLMACIQRLAGRSDLHFVLLGSGDLFTHYQRQLEGCGNVSFIPKIPRTQVHDFLRHCDVLLLSTHQSPLWRFGQSLNKMVDYMLAGRPVIAAMTGAPSMITEAGSGIFVPAGSVDALEEGILTLAAMSDSSRNDMGRRGREWILAHRSYAQLAQDYLGAIAALRSPSRDQTEANG
jgi:glycosyltransferase involved in cell wall biosynthesis